MDYIGYDALIEKALRSVLKDVLNYVRVKGLEGGHYFLIRFYVNYKGVQISDETRKQYPHDMTVVLQNQFDGLEVSDEGFSVNLVFAGEKEKIFVPFDSISSFADPGACFGLKFSVEDFQAINSKDDIDDDLYKPSVEGEVINIQNYRKK